MTQGKTFKRRVRARMAKTGESYSSARRILLADGGRAQPAHAALGGPAARPRASDEAVGRATGRTWDEWFAELDRWGASSRRHPEIARWLVSEHGVAGWWSQAVTVAYEQARGMREPGQRQNGWAASASKTVRVPVERLFAAFADEQERLDWLPDAQLRLRTASAPRSARFDWGDGASRVNVWLTAVDGAKSRVALQHERLPDRDTANDMAAWWRERLGRLAALPGAGGDR